MPAAYPPGPIEEAGLTVLQLMYRGHFARDNVYRVRMECCGNTRKIRHDGIQSRILRGIKRCHACGNFENNFKKMGQTSEKAKYTWLHGIAPPTWAKPPSIPTGRAIGIWGDRQ